MSSFGVVNPHPQSRYQRCCPVAGWPWTSGPSMFHWGIPSSHQSIFVLFPMHLHNPQMDSTRANGSRATTVVRFLAGCCLISLVYFSREVDVWLEGLWRGLRRTYLFRLDSFEPLLVTLCVAVSSVFFRVLDSLPQFSKAWRIQDSDDVSHWKIERGERFSQEFLWYWLVLGIFDWAYPRRLLPETAPTAGQIFSEVLGGLVLYDHLFFWVHLAFHKIPFLYKHVHAKHHTKKVIRAWEAWRLTIWEEVADVGCSIAALNLMKCHPLSRALYNIVIVYLIAELHSGLDMPWMLQNVVPFGICGGSRRHDCHHQCGTKFYQKFFTYMDDLLLLCTSNRNCLKKQ